MYVLCGVQTEWTAARDARERAVTGAVGDGVVLVVLVATALVLVIVVALVVELPTTTIG